MHESSLARQLLKVVIERAHAERCTRVMRVEGWIAESEALSPEALSVHFEALARGTLAEGAEVQLEVVHVRAKCDRCHTAYLPDHHLLLCPACGSLDGTLEGPTGVAITRLQVV